MMVSILFTTGISVNQALYQIECLESIRITRSSCSADLLLNCLSIDLQDSIWTVDDLLTLLKSKVVNRITARISTSIKHEISMPIPSQSLLYLDLSFSQLLDSDLLLLLPLMPNLIDFKISYTKITDLSIVCLSQACKSIRNIEVAETEISEVAIYAMSQIKMLESLVADGCVNLTSSSILHIIKSTGLMLLSLDSIPSIETSFISSFSTPHASNSCLLLAQDIQLIRNIKLDKVNEDLVGFCKDLSKRDLFGDILGIATPPASPDRKEDIYVPKKGKKINDDGWLSGANVDDKIKKAPVKSNTPLTRTSSIDKRPPFSYTSTTPVISTSKGLSSPSKSKTTTTNKRTSISSTKTSLTNKRLSLNPASAKPITNTASTASKRLSYSSKQISNPTPSKPITLTSSSTPSKRLSQPNTPNQRRSSLLKQPTVLHEMVKDKAKAEIVDSYNENPLLS